jgi:hypothetical protein
MKNLIVSESQNDITGFHKIGVLSLISAFGLWTVVPVHAVTLNDDGVLGKLKVDHELVEHDNLFIEGDAVLTQRGRHGNFEVSTLAKGKAFEVAQHPVRLTAVLASTIARWIGFKLLAAIGADDGNLGLPVGVLGTTTGGKLARCVEARFGAVKGVLSDTLAYLKLLTALLAGTGYLRVLFVNLLFTVACMSTFYRAELCLSRTLRGGVEGSAACSALLRYARRLVALVGAENVFVSLAPSGGHFDGFTADGAGVKRHKRNLLSDGWHVCLGHAAPTGGIHNYIRLSTNHQMQRVLSPFIIAQMEVCGNG